jgi:predicted branched-subunit amino acid permease
MDRSDAPAAAPARAPGGAPLPGAPPPTNRELLRRAIGPALAIGLFGFTIGVVAQSNGLGWAAPTLFSATTFAGAAQYAAIGVITGGGSIVAAIVAGALANLRFLPIGISVASCFRGSRLRRAVECQVVSDVNWAFAHRGDGTYDRRTLLGLGVVVWAVWVVATLIGALVGDAVGDPRRFGLDALFPAMFVAVLMPQVRVRRNAVAAAVAAALALIAVPWVPPGLPILAGTLAVLLGVRRRPAEEAAQ